jgi:hypothetical protein
LSEELTIQELFDKNPEKLTKEERQRIIIQYRQNRHLWVAGQRPKKDAATPTVVDKAGLVELD